MNLKKFKKSLVSIVLGSSLFLCNIGVIFQQPKAWFSDEFITAARRKYRWNPKMTKIINVLKFFSDLHKKPKYADALSFIYTSSCLRSENLTPVSESAELKKSFRVLFVRAMMAATAIGSFNSMVLRTPDGTTTKMLTKELLFGYLHYLCSEYDIGTKILQEELELIFSDQQINDPQVEKPEGYSRFDNSKLDIQLKNLLTSAIELLSE